MTRFLVFVLVAIVAACSFVPQASAITLPPWVLRAYPDGGGYYLIRTAVRPGPSGLPGARAYVPKACGVAWPTPGGPGLVYWDGACWIRA
jgi:hypothetical protein